MSNHARGLWGYGGRTAAGEELTIQSTGMGGPSAAVVLADLAKLGVRRAVRIGTCATVGAEAEPGELIVVEAARAEGGSAAAFGVPAGETVLPELELTAGLQRELADTARSGRVASFDTIYAGAEPVSDGVFAVDMQTATVLACARALKIAAATVLIVETAASGERAPDDVLEEAAKRAGRAAVGSLSP